MLNVLIPMSGRGSRFAEVGYKMPKPLIDVNGKPMIERVISNIGLRARYIFCVLKEHNDQFNLENILPKFCPEPDDLHEIIIVDQVTEGAACTCLLSERFINNDDELIIANSDQLINWISALDFVQDMNDKMADGGIVTFSVNENDSKWSFAKLNLYGDVTKVAEKKQISNNATAGVYWFKHGKDFVSAAKQMIKKDIRTNNEYYVAPVFNELILDKKKIITYHVDKIFGLGIPQDLEKYLDLCKNKI